MSAEVRMPDTPGAHIAVSSHVGGDTVRVMYNRDKNLVTAFIGRADLTMTPAQWAVLNDRVKAVTA